jgi:hypothetical protein
MKTTTLNTVKNRSSGGQTLMNALDWQSNADA